MIEDSIALRYLADIRVSNIDKKSQSNEVPIRLVNYTDVYYLESVDPTLNMMPATATREQIERFRVYAGDTLITKDSESPDDIAATAYVRASDSSMVCGYHLAIIRPRTLVPRYLTWALRSQRVLGQYSSRANGMTRYGLSQGAIGSALIPALSSDHQQRVAGFLDDQIARIENIISARQQQITELNDLYRSGIDDNLRANANEKTARLARFGRVQTGVTVDSGRETDADEDAPYLRVANVQAGSLDLDEIKYIRLAPARIERHLLRFGDVLMTEGGDLDKLGRGTVWRCEVPGAIHQNHVFAVRVQRELLLPEYLAAVTESTFTRNYFELTGNRTTNLASTSASKVLDLPIVIRSIDVQQRLLASITQLAEQVRVGQATLRTAIERAKDMRQSLITAAVSGEFDVSSADGSRVPV